MPVRVQDNGNPWGLGVVGMAFSKDGGTRSGLGGIYHTGDTLGLGGASLGGAGITGRSVLG